MGTRNLTIVVADGQNRIAQYGQFDGYPSGQGETVLKFCRTRLANPMGRTRFRKALEQVHFVDGPEADRLATEKNWEKLYPAIHRNTAAQILEHVWDRYYTTDNKKQIPVVDQSNFAADSLFCEWVYLIDLDKHTLEVYKGFNQIRLSEEDRFAYLVGTKEYRNEKYQPVKLKKAWSLDSLPTQDEFFNTLCPPTEEEE